MTAVRFDLEHWIHANAAGECGGGLSSITVGERICRDTENGWWHLDCAITAATTFEPIPTAWWCLTHDQAARNGAECTWGHLGSCRLAPIYTRSEDT